MSARAFCDARRATGQSRQRRTKDGRQPRIRPSSSVIRPRNCVRAGNANRDARISSTCHQNWHGDGTRAPVPRRRSADSIDRYAGGRNDSANGASGTTCGKRRGRARAFDDKRPERHCERRSREAISNVVICIFWASRRLSKHNVITIPSPR